MPFTPLFDGLAIFGDAVTILAVANPPDVQVSAFPGVNGIDLLTLGTRGYILRATGVLQAPTPAGRLVLLAAWDGLIGSPNHVVRDTAGRTWTSCLVRSFRPTSRLLEDAADPDQAGGEVFAVAYEADILAPLPPIYPG